MYMHNYVHVPFYKIVIIACVWMSQQLYTLYVIHNYFEVRSSGIQDHNYSHVAMYCQYFDWNEIPDSAAVAINEMDNTSKLTRTSSKMI